MSYFDLKESSIDYRTRKQSRMFKTKVWDMGESEIEYCSGKRKGNRPPHLLLKVEVRRGNKMKILHRRICQYRNPKMEDDYEEHYCTWSVNYDYLRNKLPKYAR